MTGPVTPTLDSEITWLLHRAAQRMRAVTSEQAEAGGVQLRDHIVLSALHKAPGLTQVELARELGLDKTTLMSQLDGLERSGLVVRKADPSDRRARIPEITAEGERVRARVARQSEKAERAALAAFDATEIQNLRRILFGIIGDSDDAGSCL